MTKNEKDTLDHLADILTGEAEAITELGERLVYDEGWILLPPEAERIIAALTLFIREAPKMTPEKRQTALAASIETMTAALKDFWVRFDNAFGNR